MRLGQIIAMNKLSAGGPGSGRHAGVNAVIEALHLNHPVNPVNSAGRILMVGGKKVGGFTVSERAGRLRIRDIHSDEAGSGVGTLLLKRILREADKHGVTTELTASSYGTHNLSTDQLKEWYGRHGFVKEPGTDEAYGYMIRNSSK